MTSPDTVELEIGDGERWWGGAVADGTLMPWGLGDAPLQRDLEVNAGGLHAPADLANQSSPLLVSSAGRYVISEHPFTLDLSDARLQVTGRDLVAGRGAEPTLRGGYRAATAALCPPDGVAPARELFTGPQYNTWIEIPFTPTQEQVLEYARRVLAAGLPPGVLMIDDTWSPDYGDWQFDTRRFPDAAAMVAELADLGFAVMLWTVPFISPDSAVYRELEQRGLLLRGADGEVAVRRWWNGWSAVLDLTDPQARRWWGTGLRALQQQTGVAGFKFDGGDLRDYRVGDRGVGGSSPVDQTLAYGRFGEEFAFNEFRAGWRAGGRGLAQRLHDKPPTWGADGLGSLIPEAIVQSLTGHAFICPDMVGGGNLVTFEPGAAIDVEQFVRYAQCAALFPMMQFSLNPARVLDGAPLQAVRDAVAFRQGLVPQILSLVEDAASTGEPILRPLAYHHPGLEQVTDQYLLGEDLLVAPVLTAGAATREVVLPAGTWIPVGPGMPSRAPQGSDDAPTTVTIAVTLATLPVWQRSR